MSSTLPEDTEADLKREFARGVASFRGGASMPNPRRFFAREV